MCGVVRWLISFCWIVVFEISLVMFDFRIVFLKGNEMFLVSTNSVSGGFTSLMLKFSPDVREVRGAEDGGVDTSTRRLHSEGSASI